MSICLLTAANILACPHSDQIRSTVRVAIYNLVCYSLASPRFWENFLSYLSEDRLVRNINVCWIRSILKSLVYDNLVLEIVFSV